MSILSSTFDEELSTRDHVSLSMPAGLDIVSDLMLATRRLTRNYVPVYQAEPTLDRTHKIPSETIQTGADVSITCFPINSPRCKAEAKHDI